MNEAKTSIPKKEQFFLYYEDDYSYNGPELIGTYKTIEECWNEINKQNMNSYITNPNMYINPTEYIRHTSIVSEFCIRYPKNKEDKKYYMFDIPKQNSFKSDDIIMVSSEPPGIYIFATITDIIKSDSL